MSLQLDFEKKQIKIDKPISVVDLLNVINDYKKLKDIDENWVIIPNNINNTVSESKKPKELIKN